MDRFALWFAAAMFAGAGVAFLLLPTWMAGHIDIAAGSPSAVADIRAVYGGLELGFAVFLGRCASSPQTAALRTGLVAATTVLAGMALARIVGFALDGPQTPLSWALLAGELAGTTLCGLSLRKAPRSVGP